MGKKNAEISTNNNNAQNKMLVDGVSAPDSPLTKESRYPMKIDTDRPNMLWANKKKKELVIIPAVSLRVSERIDPKGLLSKYLADRPGSTPMQGAFERVQCYIHPDGWINRLVLGDSLLVMNSLLENDAMRGKVQMIYLDPPYGIDFKSDLQVAMNEGSVINGDGRMSSRGIDQIRAYGDTWQHGIHSYIDHLHDRLLMCKELLAPAGSIFVQIGINNVHYVHMLMEEIFGQESFNTIISFRKKGSTSAKLLPVMNDFIVWFVKDKKRVKINPLYISKEKEFNSYPEYDHVELADGTIRVMNPPERLNPGLIPDDSRIVHLVDLQEPSPEVLNKLTKEGRILVQQGHVYYKAYLDDEPDGPLANFWNDTRGDMQMRYIVQTAEKVVERCVLMATDPGDLVVDPTCGSGTTAVVAERLGRRWITCDTSRVAISHARTRLMLGLFDYYRITGPGKPLAFTYNERVVRRLETAVNSSGKKQTGTIVLVDKPKVDKSVIRVAGPFRCEKISASPAGNAINLFRNKILSHIERDGIVYPGSRLLHFDVVEPVESDGHEIHARAVIRVPAQRRAAISIGPEHGMVSPAQVEAAVLAASSQAFDQVFFLGLGFDEAAQLRISEINAKTSSLRCELVYINPDVAIKDLEAGSIGEHLFAVAGTPALHLIKNERDSTVQVRLEGMAFFNPQLGTVDDAGPGKIYCIMIDDAYDGHVFQPRQVLFPRINADAREHNADSMESEEHDGDLDAAGDDSAGQDDDAGDMDENPAPAISRKKTANKQDIDISVKMFTKKMASKKSSGHDVADPAKLGCLVGNTSLPFKPPLDGKVFVKIIDLHGIETCMMLNTN